MAALHFVLAFTLKITRFPRKRVPSGAHRTERTDAGQTSRKSAGLAAVAKKARACELNLPTGSPK